MGTVVTGMDPHKRSAAIEVMAVGERILGGGRYGTGAAGYAAMLAYVRRWPERTWAIGGCQGIGGHIAARLAAAGEQVVDVPPRLSARTRVFTAGQGRKTDAADALAATRMTGLRQVTGNEQLEVLRVLAGRRRSLGEDHTRMICQWHRLLPELIQGGRRRPCPRLRPGSCRPGSGRGTRPDRPGGGSPPGWPATWSGSTSARKPRTGS
jgi:hypothetical protein